MIDPSTIEADSLDLRPDGTVVVAWSPAPVVVNDAGLPGDERTFVPAWVIRRPVVRELRHLTELWHELLAARRDAQLAATDEARKLAERIKAGEDMTDVDVDKAAGAARDLITSTERVAWPWWVECVAMLGTPVGDHPRVVDDGDAPPWLVQNAAVYVSLTTHWQTAPLPRGTSVQAAQPTVPARPPALNR